MVTESWNPTVVCAWCSKTLTAGEKNLVSHGMCRKCSLEEMNDDSLLVWWEVLELWVWRWGARAVIATSGLGLALALYGWYLRDWAVLG